MFPGLSIKYTGKKAENVVNYRTTFSAENTKSNGARNWLLSTAELAEYGSAGLVRPAWRFDEAAVCEMRELLELTLTVTAGQRPETLVCPHIEGMNKLSGEISRRWLDLATRTELGGHCRAGPWPGHNPVGQSSLL